MILAYNTSGRLGTGETKKEAYRDAQTTDKDNVIYFEGNGIEDINLKRIWKMLYDLYGGQYLNMLEELNELLTKNEILNLDYM